MLAEAVQSYLAVRRATGFDLKLQGSLLKSFTTFSEAKGQHCIYSETAIEWAGSARSVLQRARRLGAVIRFARYIRMEDQRHQVPPAVFGRENHSRPVPFIFAKDEIRGLHEAAAELGRRDSFRGHT